MTLCRRRFVQATVPIIALPFVAAYSPLEKLFAPASVKWAHWEPFDPDSTRQMDHSAWDAFVKKYVSTGEDGVNRVAYGSVGEDDLKTLDGYLDGLAVADVATLNRAEQFAVWVNLYNASVVRALITFGPVKSIKDIDLQGGMFADGPWETPIAEMDGFDLSLNDIEHRILRPIWEDARVHYALNRGAMGCPNLRRAAFTAQNTEELLADGARDFIGHPRGVRLSDEGVVASKIYLWFQEDFGEDELAVLRHLADHAGPSKRDRLLAATGISAYSYDWSLNGGF